MIILKLATLTALMKEKLAVAVNELKTAMWRNRVLAKTWFLSSLVQDD
jgi:hypothetical protein